MTKLRLACGAILIACALLVSLFVILPRQAKKDSGGEQDESFSVHMCEEVPRGIALSNNSAAVKTEALLHLMSAKTRRYVSREPWIKDGDAESVDLLSTIRSIDCYLIWDKDHLGDRSIVTSDPTAILRAAKDEHWSDDGYSQLEKRALKGFYISFLRPSLSSPGETLATSLRRRDYRFLNLPRSGERFLVGTGDDQDLVRRTMADLDAPFQQLNAWFGPLRFSSIVISIGETSSPGYCAETYADRQRIIFQADCDEPNATAHELTHLYLNQNLGQDYPFWYAEGVAYFWSAVLTNSIESTERLFRSRLESSSTPVQFDLESHKFGPFFSQDYSGALLMFELQRLLGTDVMVSITSSLKGGASGKTILDRFRQFTPAAQKDSLEELLGRYLPISPR